MTVKQLVEAIDARILAGDILGAFDQFAAEDCVTLSGEHDITRTKAQKMEALRWFFNNIASVNRIERVGFATSGNDSSDSQFVFEFTNQFGQNLVYSEVIRRTWAGEQLVREEYLLGAELPKAAAKTTKKVAAEKTEAPAPAPAKATKAPKKAAVATEKKAPKASVPADDLTLIEGIGPKIAELLIAAGIVNFADLAKAKPAAIKTILEAAGKRYQMHDPATWPKQAALARDGKTAELEALQAKLKGGK
jgi:predicted flap endonuclease-1-like 5' DNA nuclease